MALVSAPPQARAERPGADVSEAGYPSPRRAWWSVFVLTALYSLSLLDRHIIALLVHDIRADLHISDFQMGLLQGVGFALFYVTFGLLFGWVIDRFSRRGVVFLGVTVWSLATAACGLARNFGQLVGARFGVGAGEAALNPAAYSIISDTFPRRRLSLAISVFGTGANLGGGLSLLLGGFLITVLPKDGVTLPVLGHLQAWRVVFLAAGLPGLLIVLLIWTAPDPRRRERLLGATSLRDTLAFVRGRWRFFSGHFLGFALLAASANGYQAWAPTYLMREFGMPVTQVVSILAPISLLAGVTGSIFAGYVTDRWFARGRADAHLRFFIFATAVQLVGLCVAMTSRRLEVFVPFVIVAHLAGGFAGVAPAALQLTTPNNYRGQVSAAYLFVFNLVGMGLGPTMVGALTTWVFRDDAKVGWAVATNSLIVLPLAIVAFACSLAPMRRAVAQASAWSVQDAPRAARAVD
ncbi:MFS transporter [Phenylobacterium sp.]|jgi:MFS family permease|uniref:MFS transporter n=1 Tax=Phenylobacterium sp. TaxID=1871053 RepID=UPI002F40CAAC